MIVIIAAITSLACMVFAAVLLVDGHVGEASGFVAFSFVCATAAYRGLTHAR